MIHDRRETSDTTTRDRGDTEPPRRSPRDRIIDAAVQAVSANGVAGLTFRSIANEAEVSLGTITYHFTDRNALLKAAIERVRDEDVARDLPLLKTLFDEHGIAEGLARYLVHTTGAGHDVLMDVYRVYISVLFVPELLTDTQFWRLDDIVFEHLADRERSRDLAIVVEGALMYSVINDVAFTVDEARRLLTPHFPPRL